jgi:hypothetical protein
MAELLKPLAYYDLSQGGQTTTDQGIHVAAAESGLWATPGQRRTADVLAGQIAPYVQRHRDLSLEDRRAQVASDIVSAPGWVFAYENSQVAESGDGQATLAVLAFACVEKVLAPRQRALSSSGVVEAGGCTLPEFGVTHSWDLRLSTSPSAQRQLLAAAGLMGALLYGVPDGANVAARVYPGDTRDGYLFRALSFRKIEFLHTPTDEASTWWRGLAGVVRSRAAGIQIAVDKHAVTVISPTDKA